MLVLVHVAVLVFVDVIVIVSVIVVVVVAGPRGARIREKAVGGSSRSRVCCTRQVAQRTGSGLAPAKSTNEKTMNKRSTAASQTFLMLSVVLSGWLFTHDSP